MPDDILSSLISPVRMVFDLLTNWFHIFSCIDTQYAQHQFLCFRAADMRRTTWFGLPSPLEISYLLSILSICPRVLNWYNSVSSETLNETLSVTCINACFIHRGKSPELDLPDSDGRSNVTIFTMTFFYSINKSVLPRIDHPHARPTGRASTKSNL